MTLPNGYTMTTTFGTDFTIADKFGIKAVKDTFKRAFNEWKDNYVYLTELVIVLNHKIWEWYQKDEQLALTYQELWEKADTYACDNLTGKELEFFYVTTD